MKPRIDSYVICPTKRKLTHRFFCFGQCRRELNGYYMGDCPHCNGLVSAQIWEEGTKID